MRVLLALLVDQKSCCAFFIQQSAETCFLLDDLQFVWEFVISDTMIIGALKFIDFVL